MQTSTFLVLLLVLQSVLVGGVAGHVLPDSQILVEPCLDDLGNDHWSLPNQGTFRLLGTSDTQRAIQQNQHPANCRSSKYLVTWFDHSGVGSIVHILSHCLKLGLMMNRVVAFRPHRDQVYLQGDFCGGASTLDGCFFHPFSCDLSHNFPDVEKLGVDLDLTKDQSHHQFLHAKHPLSCVNLPTDAESLRRVTNASTSLHRQDILNIFEGKFGRRTNQAHFYRSWWRAQTAAYLLRPTRRTMREVKRVLKEHLKPSNSIPQGAISLFVRGGDKKIEFPLSSNEDYLGCVESISMNDSINVILTTDSPDAVNFFRSQDHLRVLWLDVQRYNESTITTTEYAQLRGGTREFLNHFSNLYLSLQGSSFVATTETSNWSQLMDELRSTVGCNAEALFLDPTFTDCRPNELSGSRNIGMRSRWTAAEIEAYRKDARQRWDMQRKDLVKERGSIREKKTA